MTYRKLEAWILSRQLAIDIFGITASEPMRRCFGLCDQMQRAAISIPSNIAEGEERGSNRDALRFLFFAKGSLAELRTQLDIAHAAGKIPPATFGEKDAALQRVGRLLGGLIKMRLSLEQQRSHPDSPPSSAPRDSPICLRPLPPSTRQSSEPETHPYLDQGGVDSPRARRPID